MGEEVRMGRELGEGFSGEREGRGRAGGSHY